MPDAPFGTIYLGAPIELASERMVIAALAKRLDQDQAPYVVIANAQIGGRQIDCLVQVWLICSMTLRGRSSIGWNPTGSNFIRRRRSSGSPLWAATYAVALSAARVLLELHPEAGGFKVAPGAHMALPLDIMSEEPGLVGAETFAAVHPRNNGKLAADLAKLADRPETHRYVFFMSPRHPGAQRQPALERDSVQVWSVDV